MEPNTRSLLIEGRVHRKVPRQQRILIRGIIFAVSLLLLGFLATHAATAAGKPFHYDPSTCTSDAHGKFYVALGTTILALPPPSGPFMVDDTALPKRLPPIPDDHIGCPGNPLQTRTYGYLSPSQANGSHTRNENSTTRTGVSELTLYDLRFGGRRPDADSEVWSGETGLQGDVASICKDATIRQDLPIGFTACRLQQSKSVTLIPDWETAYVAHADVYTTPLGRPFVVECGQYLYSTGIAKCRVAYSITPLLGLSYTFEPYIGRVILRVDQLIDFDRRLRSSIDAAVIRDYRWPKAKSTGP